MNDSIGIYSAATGVLIGASLHAIIRIIDTFGTGYKYSPELKASHPGFKKILKLNLLYVRLKKIKLNLHILDK